MCDLPWFKISLAHVPPPDGRKRTSEPSCQQPVLPLLPNITGPSQSWQLGNFVTNGYTVTARQYKLGQMSPLAKKDWLCQRLLLDFFYQTQVQSLLGIASHWLTEGSTFTNLSITMTKSFCVGFAKLGLGKEDSVSQFRKSIWKNCPRIGFGPILVSSDSVHKNPITNW